MITGFSTNNISFRNGGGAVIKPRQKDLLRPRIMDWRKRLEKNAAAEAFLATFEGKQRWAESDIGQCGERLEEANCALHSS